MYFWAVLIGCGFMWLIPKVLCNPCSKNCQSCTLDGTNICTSCIDGYWPSGSSCQPCSNNCATCSDASSCTTCKPTFYAPTGICLLKCPTVCLEGLCDENSAYCTECISERYGYQCAFDCKLCKNEQCDLRRCTDGCKSGYWQHQKMHIGCIPCTDNCVSCVNGSICNMCKIGTFLDKYSDTQNYCIQCPSTCEQCSSINSCSACKPGYYGIACEFNCSAYTAGCQQCDWDGRSRVTCSQCYNGWTLQDKACVKVPYLCPINCESCLGDNVCEKCMTGWVGALCDMTCRDILHCVACHEADGSIMCNVCDEGYEVMNGECSATSKKDAVQPTFAISTSATTKEITISDPPVCVKGIVIGIGICTCAILLTGLVWFLRRRKRLNESTTSRQNEPFYENSFAANESHLTTMNTEGSNEENIQQMPVVEEKKVNQSRKHTRLL